MSIFITGLVHRNVVCRSLLPSATTATMATTAMRARTKMRMAMNNNSSSTSSSTSLFSSVTSSSSSSSKSLLMMPSTTTNRRNLLSSSLLSSINKRRFSTTTTTTTTTSPIGGGKVTGSSSSSSSSTASSTSNSNNSFSFLNWYEHHLSKSPITTKMISGAFLWGLGDMVAQIIPQFVSVKNDKDDKGVDDDNNGNKDIALLSSTSSTSVSTSITIESIINNYDWIRTGKAVLFGFAIHAPASHGHFNLLEYMTKKLKLNGLSIPIFKTIMEQFIYWSWISNSMYHSYMGIMDGLTLKQIYTKLENVLWDTQKAQWIFWIPIQLLNFQFIPIRHQLNVVLITSIVWTALLSMWYPPVSIKEEEESIEKESTQLTTTE